MKQWIATIIVSILLLGTVYGQGAELQLGGVILSNNSLVDASSISETIPLICGTICCEEVVWTLPNGTTAIDYQVSNTSLGVSNGTKLPSGVYRCTVSNQSIYVGIYCTNASTNDGSLRIQGLSYNTSTCTLTCVSSGGPVTTVQWLLEGNSLNQSDQSTYIADRETGRYRHTLRLMSAGSGLYSCVVENTQGNTSQDLQLCIEGSLRLQGDLYDAVLQICMLNVWQDVVLVNPFLPGTSDGGEGLFPLELEATDSTITVHWNISGSAYEVACSNGAVSTRSVLEGHKKQVTFSASAAMRYNCCVSILCNESGRIYTRTEHARSCSSVETEPEQPEQPEPEPLLSTLEIALIVLGVVLLSLLLLVALCGCLCSLSTRRKKNQYEVHLREQSNHYTKQRITLMTRPTSESAFALQDVGGGVLFNKNAQEELQETITFAPAQKRDNNMEKSVNTSKDEPQPAGRPTSTEEEASNPMYGLVSHGDEPVPSTEEEASNPVYGLVSHEDEADNPLYVAVKR